MRHRHITCFTTPVLPQIMDHVAASNQRSIARQMSFDNQPKVIQNLNAHPETSSRGATVCEKSSENLHLLANETSLALYRIEEHISKTVHHFKVSLATISNHYI